ncbi:MAG: hypothetical protein J6D28_00705 [Bacilli bacterium]|nr:hypothetical protein [Bacilli bacterium]
MIKALICELGGKGITIVARMLDMSFETVKSYYFTDYENILLKEENRGRKKVENQNPYLISQIKEIVEKYEKTDSHFKTEDLYLDLTLKNLRSELITKYNYSEKECPCENTLSRILKGLGYKIQKVKKTKVQEKVPETDAIFENVNETKQFTVLSKNEVALTIRQER